MKTDVITNLFLDRKNFIDDGFNDFRTSAVLREDAMSDGCRNMMERFKPILEAVDLNDPHKGMLGSKHSRDTFADTYKALMAAMLLNISKIPRQQLQQEATLAGTNVPTFTKQLIRTVLRAFPRLITPQLFPVVPLSAPDGRIYFPADLYDSSYAGSLPLVPVNSNVSDKSNFNTEFFRQGVQLTNLGLVKYDLSKYIVISAETYGVAAESSLQAEEDMQSIYGEDYNMKMSERMSYFLSLVIDRLMLSACISAIPAGSQLTWDRHPTINSVVWANQAPSEQNAHRDNIWRDGILPAANEIFKLYYVRPNWAIAGSDAALDIAACSSFKPVQVDATTIDMRQGAIRDIGTLDSGGMRVLVDPWLDEDTIILGYRPMADFEPAITFCPYRPIGFTDDLVEPRTLKRTKGAYTRFGIGDPDDSVPASAILGNCYASLTITETT